MQKTIDELRTEYTDEIKGLNDKISDLRKERDAQNHFLDELKFYVHGLTDTERRDVIFKKIKTDVKEVETLIRETEREREKQQSTIFEIMDKINVAGGMIPDQADAGTQTELTVTNSHSYYFTEVDNTQFGK